MTQPIHKTCYRCGRPVRALVEAERPLSAVHGVCDDCKLRIDAVTAEREWRLAHPTPEEQEGSS